MGATGLPIYIPLEEAAEKYKLSIETLTQAIKSNVVKAIRVGQTIAISDDDIIVVAAKVEAQAQGDELVSINEAARRLNIDPRIVSRWREYGWLPRLASGPRRAILVSWKRAKDLGKLYAETSQQGNPLIPRGQKVSEVLTS